MQQEELEQIDPFSDEPSVRQYTPKEISSFIYIDNGPQIMFVLAHEFYQMESNFLHAIAYQGQLARELAAARKVIQATVPRGVSLQ